MKILFSDLRNPIIEKFLIFLYMKKTSKLVYMVCFENKDGQSDCLLPFASAELAETYCSRFNSLLSTDKFHFIKLTGCPEFLAFVSNHDLD